MIHGLSGYTNHKCRCEVCRAASAAYQKDWAKRNPEKQKAIKRGVYERHAEESREYSRRYYQEHREELQEQARERSREYRRANPEKVKSATAAWQKQNPKHHHGLKQSDFLSLLESQDNKCAGCATPVELLQYPIEVDHDHSCCPGRFSCGKCIRGLLCKSCNKKDVLSGLK